VIDSPSVLGWREGLVVDVVHKKSPSSLSKSVKKERETREKGKNNERWNSYMIGTGKKDKKKKKA